MCARRSSHLQFAAFGRGDKIHDTQSLGRVGRAHREPFGDLTLWPMTFCPVMSKTPAEAHNNPARANDELTRSPAASSIEDDAAVTAQSPRQLDVFHINHKCKHTVSVTVTVDVRRTRFKTFGKIDKPCCMPGKTTSASRVTCVLKLVHVFG
jgi:hypothetical protein